MTYRPARRVDATFDPATSPSAPGEYRIRAMVADLDEVAAEVDRVWGIGRLRLLVSDSLRAKFDEQRARVDAAVASGQESFVRVQVEAMRRAWQALDRAARADGAKPLPNDVWECSLPTSGEVIALVRDEASESHAPQGRPVFTLPEVARLIESLGPAALEAKRVFPGAVITHAHSSKPFDWSKGDAMPF
jgi:hypothetical protein